MRRKITTGRWRNKDTGEVYDSYELWSLAPISGLNKKAILRSRDSMGGVPAPANHLWVKSMEAHEPVDQIVWLPASGS